LRPVFSLQLPRCFSANCPDYVTCVTREEEGGQLRPPPLGGKAPRPPTGLSHCVPSYPFRPRFPCHAVMNSPPRVLAEHPFPPPRLGMDRPTENPGKKSPPAGQRLVFFFFFPFLSFLFFLFCLFFLTPCLSLGYNPPLQTPPRLPSARGFEGPRDSPPLHSKGTFANPQPGGPELCNWPQSPRRASPPFFFGPEFSENMPFRSTCPNHRFRPRCLMGHGSPGNEPRFPTILPKRCRRLGFPPTNANVSASPPEPSASVQAVPRKILTILTPHPPNPPETPTSIPFPPPRVFPAGTN